MMIVEDLFNKVLIDPAVRLKADEFYAVSGFATPGMADRHFANIDEHASSMRISASLIVGMSRAGGVPTPSHRGFVDLVNNRYKGRFDCSYVVKGVAVHSKVFIWTRKGNPLEAYAGSANYTLTGFGKAQREILVPVNAQAALSYWKEISKDAMPCNSPEIEGSVTFYKPNIPAKKKEENVKIPLLEKGGNIHKRSGLNWGQRPGRESNQAYLPIPTPVQEAKFFPAKGEHFTVLTDDDEVLICSVAQERGKAIHTTEDNSLMGLYFRRRLGVPSGAFVRKEDLERYGRTDVSFTRIDADTYYLDFSLEAEERGAGVSSA